ncbi:MAG: hypothetical protein QOH71_3518 [Blastocatellia bacterium]|jgi:hypothetical protein|nr:hypothetical protein [Blastocatellia bacterium]
MKRDYYSDSIANFLNTSTNEILGTLARNSGFTIEQTQRDAWLEEIAILKIALRNTDGSIYFEYSIPRMGKRIDTVLLIGSALFVLEFKIGDREFTSYAMNQAYDYALDLKNFHETSRELLIAPIVIATNALAPSPAITTTVHDDKVLVPMRCTIELLPDILRRVLEFAGNESIDSGQWERGRYSPTPTIIEAAMALYNSHSVKEISRNDAAAINLSTTSAAISDIIQSARANPFKAVCFVTGVPGAGKTLVGLNIATQRRDESDDLYSVFLSGNGPLVDILREALARDRVRRAKEAGKRARKGEAMSEVKAFIQNVHHFRDEYVMDEAAPVEHVVLFDEAQRAWDLEQTAGYMRRKKGKPNFNQSEPEFLISCLDRHSDWAVVVCLVGGGQEINRGEGGISGWIDALNHSFRDWHVYISSRLSDSEYAAGHALEQLRTHSEVTIKDELHLAVSLRSFRAENVSLLVKQLLDLEQDEARKTLASVSAKYPIVLTRDLAKAKRWLREQARGTERYGIVASSQAERLKPHAINVKFTIEPVHWFLDGPQDVRSSFYLEDVATEFDVQGLELDWSCVTWDADFRYTPDGWLHKSFCGDSWNRINKRERQVYQKNAYRVLLTRARQGMVIVVPNGDSADPTRNPEFYDPTFEYLREIGFRTI